VDGAALECFVYLNEYGPRTIVFKGSAYRFWVNDENRLCATLRIMEEHASLDSEGREVVLESLNYHLPVKKWVRVGMQFNGYSFILLADGIERSRESFKRRMRLFGHNDTSLKLGSREQSFNGRIDELRVSAVVFGEEAPFHDSIRLLGDPFTVHFDAKGFLDRDYHTRPVSIDFIHEETRKHEVTIGLMGEVK
jgi:hypothetical protein